MATDVTCLYTRVRNNSGVRKKYGFLPPHGHELAANAELLVLGDLRSRIANHPNARDRQNASFEAALGNNHITLIRTPEPIMYDVLTDATRMIKFSNNSLVLDDPCWESLAR